MPLEDDFKGGILQDRKLSKSSLIRLVLILGGITLGIFFLVYQYLILPSQNDRLYIVDSTDSEGFFLNLQMIVGETSPTLTTILKDIQFPPTTIQIDDNLTQTWSSRINEDIILPQDMLSTVLRSKDNAKTVCIKRLMLEQSSNHESSSVDIIFNRSSNLLSEYYLTNICVEEKLSERLGTGDPKILYSSYLTKNDPDYGTLIDEVPVTELRSTYFFPFDRRTISLALSAEKEIRSPSGDLAIHNRPFAPSIYLSVSSIEWEESVAFRSGFIGTGSRVYAFGFGGISDRITEYGVPAIEISVDLYRPLSVRLLTIIVLTALLFFITLLVFVETTGEFLEVSIGILLGLWGVQDILTPAYINQRIIIDDIILLFYVYLALIVFFRFALWPLWHLLGPPTPPKKRVAELSPQSQTEESQPVAQGSHSNNTLSVVTAVSVAITALITLLHFIRSRRQLNDLEN